MEGSDGLEDGDGNTSDSSGLSPVHTSNQQVIKGSFADLIHAFKLAFYCWDAVGRLLHIIRKALAALPLSSWRTHQTVHAANPRMPAPALESKKRPPAANPRTSDTPER